MRNVAANSDDASDFEGTKLFSNLRSDVSRSEDDDLRSFERLDWTYEVPTMRHLLTAVNREVLRDGENLAHDVLRNNRPISRTSNVGNLNVFGKLQPAGVHVAASPGHLYESERGTRLQHAGSRLADDHLGTCDSVLDLFIEELRAVIFHLLDYSTLTRRLANLCHMLLIERCKHQYFHSRTFLLVKFVDLLHMPI